MPTSDQSAGSGDDDDGGLDTATIMIVVIAAGIPTLLGLAAALIWRVRKGHTPEGSLPIPQAVPPVNNPAFEPAHAAVNDDEVGNVMPPRVPQYDTVGFVRDQYAALGPHSTYTSVDTEA